MKKVLMAACVMVLLTGSVQASEETDQVRLWGFGRDNGLTLRRHLAQWQVGIIVGPNDYLRDENVIRFDSDYPDSLQGSPHRDDRNRRDSGFFPLHIAHEILQHRTLKFYGVLSGVYSWEDFKYEDTDYYFGEDGQIYYQKYVEDQFRKLRQLMVGFRLAWFPVPIVSLEHAFGLSYRWTDTESERSRYYSNLDDYYREPADYQSFESFGPSNLTSNLQMVVWF